MKTEHKSNTPTEIRDSWQTPKALFNNLNKEFGFVCDVAASEENKLCEFHIDLQQNALSEDSEWESSNWCNPNYSNIQPWIEKAIEQHGQHKTIVMLVPSDTSVKWFKAAYDSCSEVRFISGRLSFINADTQKPVNGSNKGSYLYGERIVKAIA
jgi:phage N-6-adenine-methyltransferase